MDIFVGMHEIPVIYGLTIGEYGNMVNGEDWLKMVSKLNILSLKWPITTKATLWCIRKAIPNLPNDNAINLYPSLCFLKELISL